MDNYMQQEVFQREGDPLIYLQVMGQWFYYDPASQPLGEGAMGTVYLGYSCNSNFRIAVKRVRDTFANNKQIRERAQQEASLSFTHPNLVQMIGMCRSHPDKGPIFILSNYVAGITLEAHVKEQMSQLSPQDRIEKICNEMCSVLDALQYLHTRGVVHRDVKPSNIMIENGTVVKLMDLGIARMNGGNKYSSFGFIGTPQYAAPEQILREDKHSEINARTDIYSLGITFYELLTGTNPFNSKIEAEILSNQVTKKFPYDKSIPKKLYKVLLKATEKESDKRYANAYEFKDAINDALYRPNENKVASWFEDHKTLAFTTVAIIAAILLVITILFAIK